MITDTDVHISLNALQGIAGGNTLQLKGLIKRQEVPFLMDTGSTHNFISARWVKKLGLKTQQIKDFPVQIASNKKLAINSKCEQLTWKFDTHEFVGDFPVLPSNSFGVILGRQWFKTLGVISWNCSTLTMQFLHQGRPISLQGEQQSSKNMEFGSNLSLFSLVPFLLALQGSDYLAVDDSRVDGSLEPEREEQLSTLLEKYHKLFLEPTQLPPKRRYDHRIMLSDAQPVCTKPYRYTHYQKEEIERHVESLLKTRFVRESATNYVTYGFGEEKGSNMEMLYRL
jgi:hypothetical protein